MTRIDNYSISVFQYSISWKIDSPQEVHIFSKVIDPKGRLIAAKLHDKAMYVHNLVVDSDPSG